MLAGTTSARSTSRGAASHAAVDAKSSLAAPGVAPAPVLSAPAAPSVDDEPDIPALIIPPEALEPPPSAPRRHVELTVAALEAAALAAAADAVGSDIEAAALADIGGVEDALVAPRSEAEIPMAAGARSELSQPSAAGSESQPTRARASAGNAYASATDAVPPAASHFAATERAQATASTIASPTYARSSAATTRATAHTPANASADAAVPPAAVHAPAAGYASAIASTVPPTYAWTPGAAGRATEGSFAPAAPPSAAGSPAQAVRHAVTLEGTGRGRVTAAPQPASSKPASIDSAGAPPTRAAEPTAPVILRTGDATGSARTGDAPVIIRTGGATGSVLTGDAAASARTGDATGSVRGDTTGSVRTDPTGSVPLEGRYHRNARHSSRPPNRRARREAARRAAMLEREATGATVVPDAAKAKDARNPTGAAKKAKPVESARPQTKDEGSVRDALVGGTRRWLARVSRQATFSPALGHASLVGAGIVCVLAFAAVGLRQLESRPTGPGPGSVQTAPDSTASPPPVRHEVVEAPKPASTPETTLDPATAPPAQQAPTPAAAVSGRNARVPAINPWADPLPPELDGLPELASKGDHGSDETMARLRAYSRFNEGDARGLLLMGRFYMNRYWRGDGLGEYQLAIERDPAVRGAPEIMSAIIECIVTGKNADKAEELLMRVYGREALPQIELALERLQKPLSIQRLSAVRTKLLDRQDRP